MNQVSILDPYNDIFNKQALYVCSRSTIPIRYSKPYVKNQTKNDAFKICPRF